MIFQAVYSLVSFAGTGLGPAYAGFIVSSPLLGWRWLQWLQVSRHTTFYLLRVLSLFSR